MTDRQQLIVNNVDTAKQLILDAERWIWAHPQTGYTEWQAHDYLVEQLDTHSSKPETFRAFTPMLRQENQARR